MEKSVFHLSLQHQDSDSKIVVALEKISHVIRNVLWQEATKSGLSPIQIQFLVYIYHHPHLLCTVSHLADQFDLTQPTVSDAVRTLSEKKLLYRKPWEKDQRVSLLCLTSTGEDQAKQLSGWANGLKEQIAQLSIDHKEVVLTFLMSLIESFHKSGLISLTKMCFTCQYFERNAYSNLDSPHHCHLVNQPLFLQDLRIDCPEHILGK